MAEKVEIYQNLPSLGHPIPVDMTPLHVEDYVSEDKEISWVVQRLYLNRSGGPSDMRAGNPCQWLQEATQEKDPDATQWRK